MCKEHYTMVMTLYKVAWNLPCILRNWVTSFSVVQHSLSGLTCWIFMAQQVPDIHINHLSNCLFQSPVFIFVLSFTVTRLYVVLLSANTTLGGNQHFFTIAQLYMSHAVKYAYHLLSPVPKISCNFISFCPFHSMSMESKVVNFIFHLHICQWSVSMLC